jgi:hypothetical protein
MNEKEFIEYLEENGFEEKQINQLLKIQEAGYNLITYYDEDIDEEIEILEYEFITPSCNLDKLRQLKDILINYKYSDSQLTQIVVGYSNNIDYTRYSDKIYNGMQMSQIREGLEKNINILNYCDFTFNNDQMEEIRIGLLRGVNVTKYNNTKYNSNQMSQIRSGLEKKIDITRYCNELYDCEQMLQIKNGLLNCIDITKYNDLKYEYEQMHVLKNILIYNRENPSNEIDISLFENERILSYDMEMLFNKIKSNVQEFKIEAYKELNKYNQNENIKFSYDYEK